MSFDLIFVQIYPIINYFSNESVFSFIFQHKKGTIKLSKTSKISTLIFLLTPTLFILFVLFMFYLGKIWGMTQKWVVTIGVEASYQQIYIYIREWLLQLPCGQSLSESSFRVEDCILSISFAVGIKAGYYYNEMYQERLIQLPFGNSSNENCF